MDHSWRPPPLPQIQGHNNICPNCSTAHFPFCPPPPFIQNPRFNYPQSQPDYYHQRPRFDHHHPFPNPQSSLGYNPGFNPINGHVGSRPTWYGSNPSLDTSPYNAIRDPHSNYHTSGVSASYGHAGHENGGIKRMKIEPVDSSKGPVGSFMGGEIADTSRSSSDNERILKLIHDHGNAANASPGDLSNVRPNLTSESNGETGNRYAHGKPHQREAAPFHSIFQRSELNQTLVPSSFGTSFGTVAIPHGYHGQPPLPVSPPPPLPVDPPRNHFFEPFTSPPVQKPSLFPIGSRSSADSSSSSSRSAIPEHQASAQVYYANNAGHHTSTLSSSEELYTRHISSEKPNIIDASRIFKQPHRISRPDHFVIILRGLPGSGKSYMAKMLRDIEVENGGEAPRIHSMDEYFMTEVEKAEDGELSKSSGSLRGRRQVMKTVMEYCYEPEMEEAYRASMLKAFKKTLDEGVYSFIIVDDRNLRVADFAQFWATAKRSGYEVYLVEASYKDPVGCAARNVHNFTQDDIQKMAGRWEEAPSLYLKMDVKSLLHGDGTGESGIQEVDMDMEDDDDDDDHDAIDPSHGSDINNIKKDEVDDFTPQGTTSNPDDENKNHNNDHTPEVKHLSKSKWSNDLDENESFEGEKKNNGALSGLIQTYSSKEGKSVRWGDQGGNVGFSISATRKATTKRSLVIGPGSGYNLKSNPLSEEEYLKPGPNDVEPKSQNVFQQQIRAECESFKAVFDKRKQRIGGFNLDDE